MFYVIFYVYCNKYILIFVYMYYLFFDILMDDFLRLKDEKKNI